MEEGDHKPRNLMVSGNREWPSADIQEENKDQSYNHKKLNYVDNLKKEGNSFKGMLP